MRHAFRTISRLAKAAGVTCLLLLAAATFFATDLKYSPFFVRPRNFSALVRVQETRRSLDDLDYLQHRLNHSSDHLCVQNGMCQGNSYDMFVIVITLRRLANENDNGGTPRYLASSLASLMRQIDRLTYGKIGLALCDVNRQRDDFITHLNVKLNLTVFSKSKSPQGAEFVRFSGVSHDNERLDYLFCLNAAANFVEMNSNGSDFYLVVQDDAVAEEGALKFLMGWREQLKRYFGVKLHFPPKWQGFSKDVRTVLELASVFVVCGSFMTYFLLGVRRMQIALVPNFFHLLIIFGCSAMFGCLILGRQHSILAFKRMLDVHSFASLSDCCIPAVLYPSASVQLIIDGLRDKRCSKNSPFDVTLAEFVRELTNGAMGFPFLEPNLFKHIGRISTLTDAKNDLDYYNL